MSMKHRNLVALLGSLGATVIKESYGWWEAWVNGHALRWMCHLTYYGNIQYVLFREPDDTIWWHKKGYTPAMFLADSLKQKLEVDHLVVELGPCWRERKGSHMPQKVWVRLAGALAVAPFETRDPEALKLAEAVFSGDMPAPVFLDWLTDYRGLDTSKF